MTNTTQPAKTTSARGKYNGLLEIINYNRGFYALTVIGVVVGVVIVTLLPRTPALLMAGAIAAAAGWIVASLLVSHYVYDRSELYDLRWMRDRLLRSPRNWVNIHSGLDQTSEILQSAFPYSSGQILDIYDPKEMTVPSIATAREVSSNGPKAFQSGFRKRTLAVSSYDDR